MRALKPPPPAVLSFSAACKVHIHFATFTARLKSCPDTKLELFNKLLCRSVASHAFVHGIVGQLVGLLVAAAQGVADLEAGNGARELSGFLKQRPQDGAGDFVLALHLLDHQFGVGDHAQVLHVVFDGPPEHGQQAGILGVVVGPDAKEFAQFGDDLAFCVFNNCAVAGGSGIAAGTAVAVRCEQWAGRASGGGGWVWK